MLRCVHEWIEQRNASDDFGALVGIAEIEGWASTIGEMSKVEAVYIVKQLIDEGYFTSVYEAREITPEPWTYIKPQSLTEKGLVAIGEMPNPQERLILGLQAATSAVEKDRSLSPADKKRKIDWLEEGKFVVRTLGVEVARAVWRGDLPPCRKAPCSPNFR
jgi:hypothetical protein